MKLLLTNDDGIHAPGLAALLAAVRSLPEFVPDPNSASVVAPSDAWSGCSHRVTTHQPIRIEARSPDQFAVDGTPADCVRLALHALVPDFDWVLSGINAGGNLGADVYISGTVAAVREAVLHGRPGIALSQYRKRGLDFDWERASRWTARVLPILLQRPPGLGAFYNVNFPHLLPDDPEPEVICCPLDPHPLPVEFRREGDHFHYTGNYHARLARPDGDVAVCFGGSIAVTELKLG
jgi:5'-nucleotidase